MDDERARRWRLVLGGGEGPLSPGDQEIDAAMELVYGEGGGRSLPRVARWLGDIRRYFPTPVVHLLQQDALERPELRALLLEPEILEGLAPDPQLVATLIALRRTIPDRTRQTAREVVRRVVEAIRARLEVPTRQAIAAGQRASTRRPRPHEIDWSRTILSNLRHYQPDRRQIVVERLLGTRRRRPGLTEVVLCVDQSGSMGTSLVYASIFAAVLAGVPSLRTRMALFDTRVVEVTDLLPDPAELLFGIQLGGGTDIDQALAWCQRELSQPAHTLLVLISDLQDGSSQDGLPPWLARARALVQSGVKMIGLLALSDAGTPAYDPAGAAALAGLGVPTFACTPDQFPPLLARALRG